MSCKSCPGDSMCPHNSTKQSSIPSIFKKGKTKKLPEDDETVKPAECSSGGVSSDRPQGFMKYWKKCFKLHFLGNAPIKHKSKTVKVIEPIETVPPFSEISNIIAPVDPVSIPPNSATNSLDPPEDSVTSPQNPVTCSPSVMPSPSSHTSTTSSEPEESQTIQSRDAGLANNAKKSLAMEILNLSKYGWYWGPITQTEAINKLLDKPDGSFLVRDSYADHYLVSMSFKTLGKIYHTRINHNNGHFFFYTSPEHSCSSIPELIEVSMDSSKSSIFCYSRPSSPFSPSLPIRLTTPISRFTEVRSLQHLCRFVIRQYTRIDQIKQLPLPNRLCGYLEAKQF